MDLESYLERLDRGIEEQQQAVKDFKNNPNLT